MTRPGFVQEFDGLQQSAGNIGVAAAGYRGNKLGHLFLKAPFLRIGHRRTLVKGNLGDNVLFAETARVNTADGHGVPGSQGSQQVVDDGPGLV